MSREVQVGQVGAPRTTFVGALLVIAILIVPPPAILVGSQAGAASDATIVLAGGASLLEIFFLVAHDPTTRDRQGPDSGPEYRAVVFFQGATEHAAAAAYIAELTRARRFPRPIVTEVRALSGFSVAETFHQNYAFLHPTAPYIVQNDAPKLAALQQRFPQIYQKDCAP